MVVGILVPMKDMKEVRGFVEVAGVEKIVEKNIEISKCAEMIRKKLSTSYPRARVSRTLLDLLGVETVRYIRRGLFGGKIVAIYDENSGRFVEVYDKSAFKAVDEVAAKLRTTTGYNICVLQL